MTAPAPALLPCTTAPDRAPGAAPVHAASGPRASDSPGFAELLALEASPPEVTPGLQPSLLAALVPAPALGQVPAELPEATAEPGKALPVTWQKAAAPPAAFLALTITQAPASSDVATDEAGEPAAKPAAKEREAAPPVPALTLPVAAALPLPSPVAPAAAVAAAAPAASSASTPTRKSPATATTAAPAHQQTAPRTDAPTPRAAQTPHAAAFAVASLVLESEAAAPVPDAAPPVATPEPSTPETAVQNTARAQPSTLAALTGTPTPERPALRKLRSEADVTLQAAKSVAVPPPETAGALAQAQPSLVPAAPEAPATSGPQPISFDQLVDSIARARDGLAPAGPVAVAMHHAEFGRISLRIEGDGTGLAVALASPDPAFAPAVAAAHAAAVAAEPTRPAATEPRAETPGQSLAQSHGQNHGQGGSGQRQAFAAQRPAANPARPGAPAGESRGDIFA